MKTRLTIAAAALLAAALSGCAGAVREDQVEVRQLRSGTAIVLTIVEDPVDHTRCYIAYSGASCLPAAPAPAK